MSESESRSDPGQVAGAAGPGAVTAGALAATVGRLGEASRRVLDGHVPGGDMTGAARRAGAVGGVVAAAHNGWVG